MKRILIIFTALVLIIGTTSAQKFEPKWFVSGGVNSNIALNGIKNSELGGIINGGVWLNKVTGFRLSANVGNLWMTNNMNALKVGGRLDWMVNLLKNYESEKNFGLNAMFGASYGFYSMENNYPEVESLNVITVNMSIQATYKVASHLHLFLEPGMEIAPKYYEIINKEEGFAALSISAGVIYKF